MVRIDQVATLLVAIVVGTISDRTTGQPLAGVKITIGAVHATSHADGTYKIAGAKPGRATATVESDDVPPQHFTVTIGAKTTHADLIACSTTLDYNCGPMQ